MTLREIHNAIDGFEKLKEEKFEEYMLGVRKICYSVRLPYVKKGRTLKEEDIFPLKIDKEIKREKTKRMKPIVVTRTEIKKDGQ
jgi:hypothetical protein